MKFFLQLFLLIVFAVGSAAAQGRIVSGDYGSLVIGIDAKGRLTGHFAEALGVEDNGKPRFTCSFLLQSDRSSDGIYTVMTWHPNSPAEPLFGSLSATENGVVLKLPESHGGCGMVAPDIASDGGQSFELVRAGNWIGAGWVRSPKAYFHTSASAAARGKAFIVKDDRIVIYAKRGGWVEAEYTNEAGRTTRGWLKLDDLYPDEPF
ncbi:MAG: hypothetical protein IPM50_05475 [Acidobacteriota bacterium]|nr:MAG: hypothetical protein IPM50_05475 [Acidobacteriota bacterium]